MKYISLIIFIIITSCNEEQKNCNPDTYLTKKEQLSFNYKIIRYIQRLPKYATEANKFHVQFDTEYKKSLNDCSLLFYYKDKEKNIYFAIAKIAPSIKLKQTATVGKLKLDSNGIITYYEEAFRTWKMEIPELKTKSKLLFDKYIDGEDLSKFYTKNSKGEFYIEFPDDFNYYDIKLRKWETKKI
jgi:hypothetical protein